MEGQWPPHIINLKGIQNWKFIVCSVAGRLGTGAGRPATQGERLGQCTRLTWWPADRLANLVYLDKTEDMPYLGFYNCSVPGRLGIGSVRPCTLIFVSDNLLIEAWLSALCSVPGRPGQGLVDQVHMKSLFPEF